MTTNDELVMPPVEILKAEKCKRSLSFFVKEFWDVIIPDAPVWNWHIKYICDELQKVATRVFERKEKEYDLVINIPPGMSKSTLVTVMLPAWCWTIDPSIRSLTASYSSSLSTDHAIKSRDIIRSDKYKSYFPDIEIKSDQDNKTHYKNTGGGERYATSVTGTVTGFHAHLLIVDDPLNPKEATSEIERTRANDFMDITLSTRKVSKSITPTILVMQRLHTKDPTGNWLNKKGKKIKHICLPGEISNDINPPQLKKKYVNGLLDPKRLTISDINDLKIDLGSYGFSGQIMQTPSPADGGIWKKWFIPISRNEIMKLKLSKEATDWDLAYTKKETNSASAFVTAGINNKNMIITDLGFDWLEFPDLVKFMQKKQKPHYIEKKASGISAVQTLKKKGIAAIGVQPEKGDKIGRANLVSPYAESGMIFIAEDLIDKLYNDDKQGILKFPKGENDDLQDALCQSIHRCLVNKTSRVVNTGVF